MIEAVAAPSLLDRGTAESPDFFWYLKDPAGNFSEYYSYMDTVPEDELWSPEVLHGLRGLYAWGPPPPPSFLEPDDLAALMIGAHSAARQ
ncbi:2,3-dihydroxybiphenyl 1,2-dioxygenase [Mycolicibacterium flavescens]|nr:2,3-dihydroxybiphenyl 1,2-dioxygenase [Mycolicibacterium flavescens]